MNCATTTEKGGGRSDALRFQLLAGRSLRLHYLCAHTVRVARAARCHAHSSSGLSKRLPLFLFFVGSFGRLSSPPPGIPPGRVSGDSTPIAPPLARHSGLEASAAPHRLSSERGGSVGAFDRGSFRLGRSAATRPLGPRATGSGPPLRLGRGWAPTRQGGTSAAGLSRVFSQVRVRPA